MFSQLSAAIQRCITLSEDRDIVFVATYSFVVLIKYVFTNLPFGISFLRRSQGASIENMRINEKEGRGIRMGLKSSYLLTFG